MNIPLVLLGFSRVFEPMVSCSRRVAEFSVAGRDLHVAHALLALDVATPVELALAPLRPPLAPRRVAAVTAQQVATVYSFGSLQVNKWLLRTRTGSDYFLFF